MCANLISDLRNSKNGLNNLKETYNLDVKFVCDLDTLLQTIDAKLDGECSTTPIVLDKEG
jgi:hypothetical protein